MLQAGASWFEPVLVSSDGVRRGGTSGREELPEEGLPCRREPLFNVAVKAN